MPPALVDPLGFWLGVVAPCLGLGLAALLVLGKRARPRHAVGRLWLLGLPLVVVFGWRALALVRATGTDVHAARFAGSLACVGLAGLIAGWVGGKRLRAGLLTGLQVFTVTAGLVLLTGNKTFLLENSGYDFQALLPGAVAGAFALTEARFWTRSRGWIGLAAFGVTLAFAWTEPVVGGALVLVLVGLAASATTWARGKRHAGPLFALVPAALVALTLVAGSPSSSTAPAENSASDLSGAAVRVKIWRSLAPIARAQTAPLGTGQFQAAYPPLRDPDELAMTTANHTVPFVSEVEHPHNDTLLLLAENGRALALLWLLGGLALACLTVRELGAARVETRPRGHNKAAIATAASALWLAGLFHAPLFANPLAAALGALLIGATLPTAPRLVTRLLGITALLALTTALLWRGSTLESFDPTDLARAAATPEATAELDAFIAESQASGALAFDVLAHQARFSTSKLGARFWWDAALRARPFALEALTGSGYRALEQGDWRAAQAAWLRALEVDPAYPPLQRNLKRLAADLILDGHLEPGLATLDALIAANPEGAFDVHQPSHLTALATQAEEPFASAWRVAAAWLNARALFELGSTHAARKELERAAVARNATDPVSGPHLIELAVMRSLAGDVLGARAEVAHVPRATYDLWTAELPAALHTPAKLIAPK